MSDDSGPARPEAPKTIDLSPHDEEHAAAGHGRTLWPVLLLVVVVVAALGTAPYWTRMLPWSPPAPVNEAAKAELGQHDQRLTQLADRQAEVEQRLTRLEQQMKSVATPDWLREEAAAMRALNERVKALESRPAGAGDEKQIATLADALRVLQASTAEMNQRLARLEAQSQAAAKSTDPALLLAFDQLRATVERGSPYGAELDAVRALARHEPQLAPALAPLDATAASGIPGTVRLAERFRASVAPALLRAPPAPEGDSLGERVVAKLRSLVTIRHVGGAGSDDPVAAAVAKAQAALDAGDLAEAVASVESIDATRAAPAQSWLAAAHQRLAAEAALDGLARSLTAELAAAPAPAAAAPTPAPAASPAPAAAAPQH
jgi:hypothetical protein